MTDYRKSDRVTVDLPGGTFTGTIRKVLPNYAWTGRTWYHVTGKGFETIAATVRLAAEKQS